MFVSKVRFSQMSIRVACSGSVEQWLESLALDAADIAGSIQLHCDIAIVLQKQII